MNPESHVEVSRRFRATPLLRFHADLLTWTPWVQALHSALHMFDMMESVLVRIEELTEAKENP